MKFIEVNNDTTVNIDAITRIERLDMGRTLIIMPDQSVIAEIPYDTMVGLLQTQADIDKPEQATEKRNIADALNGLMENHQFTRI
jgi:hypothetical protein